MKTPHLSIKSVADRTGLSVHVIRIWERRYGAVEPVRTKTNRRVYSEEQVERLGLLRSITEAGQNIGLVAKLPLARLRTVAEEARKRVPAVGNQALAMATGSDDYVRQAISNVAAFDAAALEALISGAEVQLGAQGLLQGVIAPLAVEIGNLWRAGTLAAAHEHFATAVLGAHLKRTSRAYGGSERAPLLVVSTPAGQLHEIGALLVAATAGNLGWRVTYLGPSLPAAEIAGAARKTGARAVALSIVYPEDDPELPAELERLHAALPAEVKILAGGRAVEGYRETLKKCHAIVVSDLGELGQQLDEARKGRHGLRKS